MKSTYLLNMTLLLSAVISCTTAPCTTVQAAGDTIQVIVTGTIRTGQIAIGGETTGTTITAKGITWELEFGRNVAFRQTAAKLNGKRGVVHGSLERRKGVEIPERWIVSVTTIEPAESSPADDGSGLKAVPSRPGTRIEFTVEGNRTILDIHSETGIDRTLIQRTADTWPKSMLVRLHLKGLESFTASLDDITLEWSVSSTSEQPARVSVLTNGTERPLTPTDPYYTQVQIIGGNGRVPLQDGFFEVPLPAKLLEQNPKAITLRWIDFYRN